MSEILIEGDGEFPIDVRVPILSVQYATDGVATITAQGAYRGRLVGVAITVRGK